ncbi:ArsR/SmtB family transcription factor [Sneathiella aquimaris]|uniref:ArsR/SmtB family transcription factor n=1 Tax=Sneathiella aquimaris TaxID=2599305 RepID=UPI002260B24D|nr:metalloregulator ArsR/SmtB family transcription factor [Sneathiella aquimaris]
MMALKNMIDLDEMLDFPDEMVDNASRACTTLKAMAHESRLLILCLLANGEKSVIELEKRLSMRQPAVSQQLARLRADDLVHARREGKTIYYSIANSEVQAIIKLLYALYCAPDEAD